MERGNSLQHNFIPNERHCLNEVFKNDEKCQKADYECELCTEKLPSEEQFRQHLQTHVEQKPIKYEYCDTGFDSEDPYETHTNEEPFECNAHQKEFNNENMLEEHLDMHSVISNSTNTSENNFVFIKNIKDEVEENCNSSILGSLVNQNTIDISGVKVEKMELDETNLKVQFTEPVVKQEMLAENCGDTRDSEKMLSICTNKGDRSDSSM